MIFGLQRPKPTDQVSEEHAWIDGELATWGRWMRRREARVKCGSAEGQYRSPWRQWHYPGIEELMPNPPDDSGFWTMERAVLALPELHRDLLIAHYVSLLNPYVTCRRLRLRFGEYGKFMSDARSIVLAALQTTTS